MVISRSKLVNLVMTITTTVLDRDKINPNQLDPIPTKQKELIEQYHPPPPNVNYNSNPSIFAKILKGELPAYTYQETNELLSFRDRTPKAKLHALVIPKKYITSVKSLTNSDLDMISSMREMALDILKKEEPEAYLKNDFILCFHVPPFNSVDHLHLHVLAPASEMSYVYRYGKYLSETVWCVSDGFVIRSLKESKMISNGL